MAEPDKEEAQALTFLEGAFREGGPDRPADQQPEQQDQEEASFLEGAFTEGGPDISDTQQSPQPRGQKQQQTQQQGQGQGQTQAPNPLKQMNQQEKKWKERLKKLRKELGKDRPQTFTDSVDAFIENRNPVIDLEGRDQIRPENPMQFAEALQRSPDPEERAFGKQLELKVLQDQIKDPQRRAQQDRERLTQLTQLAQQRLQNIQQQKQQIRSRAQQQQQQAREFQQQKFENRLDILGVKRRQAAQKTRAQEQQFNQWMERAEQAPLRQTEDGQVIVQGREQLIQDFPGSPQEALNQLQGIKQQRIQERRQQRREGEDTTVGSASARRFGLNIISQAASAGKSRDQIEKMKENIREQLSQNQRIKISRAENGQPIQISQQGEVDVTPREMQKMGAMAMDLTSELGITNDEATRLVSEWVSNNSNLLRTIEGETKKSLLQRFQGSEFLDDIEEEARGIVDEVKKRAKRLKDPAETASKNYQDTETGKFLGSRSSMGKVFEDLAKNVRLLTEGEEARKVTQGIKYNEDAKKNVFEDVQSIASNRVNDLQKKINRMKKAGGFQPIGLFDSPEKEGEDFSEDQLALLEAQKRIYENLAKGKDAEKIQLSTKQKQMLQEVYGTEQGGINYEAVLEPLRMDQMDRIMGMGKTGKGDGVLSSDTVSEAMQIAKLIPGFTSFDGETPGDADANDVPADRRKEYRPSEVDNRKPVIAGQKPSQVIDSIWNEVYQQLYDGQTVQGEPDLKVLAQQQGRPGDDLNKMVMNDSDYLRTKNWVVRTLLKTYDSLQNVAFNENGEVHPDLPRRLQDRILQAAQTIDDPGQMNRVLSAIRELAEEEMNGLMEGVVRIGKDAEKNKENILDNVMRSIQR